MFTQLVYKRIKSRVTCEVPEMIGMKLNLDECTNNNRRNIYHRNKLIYPLILNLLSLHYHGHSACTLEGITFYFL